MFMVGIYSQVCESSDDQHVIGSEKDIPTVESELPHSIMDDDLEGNWFTFC